jgi:mannose/fructose/N-acetylgalactosamine-specific phosphotransferase system component IIC
VEVITDLIGMQHRLLRFVAILLFCSLPAVAHAEFIDYIGDLIAKGLSIVMYVVIGIAILLYILFRRPNAENPLLK